MENIKTCELCLGQIIKTGDFENLNCDEKQNLRILKSLEITMGRDAKICCNCVNVSHLMYNFKMSCLTNNDHLKTLIHPGINDKLILEEVVVKKSKSEFKNEKVCRFCLNFFEVNSFVEVNLEQDVVLKDMLGRCLPEIDTNIVQNPLMCYICIELLEKLFNFISQCKDTVVLGTKTDVLVNKNMPAVTVVNNDDNKDNSFAKEENCERIDNPEFQSKSDDFDIDEDIKDSINDNNCLLKEGKIHAKPSSFPSGLTHRQTHWKTRKSTIRKLYKCPRCSFQSEYRQNLVKHIENEKAYKCNMCGFKACNKCEIVKHKCESHKFRTSLGNVRNVKFSCNFCPYQTNQKHNFKRHCRVHQNLAETDLFKCHNCPYITKWKNNLEVHNIRWHEDISKLPKYKCDECPYETLWKWQLGKHKVKHRDSSRVKMQRRARKRKNAVKPVEEKDAKPKPRGKIKEKNFDVRILHPRTPSELLKFKCNNCPYKTSEKRNLDNHVLVHKDPVDTYQKSFLAHLQYYKEWKQPAKSNQDLKKLGNISVMNVLT